MQYDFYDFPNFEAHQQYLIKNYPNYVPKSEQFVSREFVAELIEKSIGTVLMSKFPEIMNASPDELKELGYITTNTTMNAARKISELLNKIRGVE